MQNERFPICIISTQIRESQLLTISQLWLTCWEAKYKKYYEHNLFTVLNVFILLYIYTQACAHTHTESFVFSRWKVHGSNKMFEVISGGYELNQDQKRMLTAIIIQLPATQGLILSPIRAHFQNMPSNPTLFLSTKLGNNDLTYAHVHISSSTTVNKLCKLKSADIIQFQVLHYHVKAQILNYK